MVNGTVLNFGKRYEDDLMVIFDQWTKLSLDALSNQKILKGIYCLLSQYLADRLSATTNSANLIYLL